MAMWRISSMRRHAAVCVMAIVVALGSVTIAVTAEAEELPLLSAAYVQPLREPEFPAVPTVVDAVIATLPAGTTGIVSFDYELVADTATVGAADDVLVSSGHVSGPAAEQYSIPISVRSDEDPEYPERFNVHVFNVVGATPTEFYQPVEVRNNNQGVGIHAVDSYPSVEGNAGERFAPETPSARMRPPLMCAAAAGMVAIID